MRSVTRSLTVGAVALVMAIGVAQVSADNKGPKEGSVRVARVTGAARYSAGNNIWQPLRDGTVLRPGAVIQTANGSQVDLLWGDREAAPPLPVVGTVVYRSSGSAGGGSGEGQVNVVRLRENTLLAIDKLTSQRTGADLVTETQLDLREGSIFGSAKKLTGASKYEIKLPNGVAGIRGTIYEVSAAGILSVYVGSVVIAYVNADGTVVTKEVFGGQQFDPRTGVISDIPDFNQKEAVKEAKRAGIGPNTAPMIYTVDRTVIFVSPTTGYNGNSGGGGGN